MTIQWMNIEEYLQKKTAQAKANITEYKELADNLLAEIGLREEREIPDSFKVDSLPRMAQLAFGARCVRRLLQSHSDWGEDGETSTVCNHIVELIETITAIADFNNPEYAKIYDEIITITKYLTFNQETIKGGYSWLNAFSTRIQPLVFATVMVVEAVDDDYKDRYEVSESFQKISIAAKLAWGGVPDGRNIIIENFKTLAELTDNESWNDDYPVSPEIFTLLSSFDTDLLVPDNNILQISSAIDQELLSLFQNNPQELYSLAPRKFEELITDLFRDFGFDATLLAQTRDGGRDIIAIDSRIVRAKYLVECKRRAPGNKIGIEVVQRLHGVVQGEGATKGILVTTSWFTKPAQKFIDEHRWQLEGWDFNKLVEWLKSYDKFIMLSS